MSQEQDKIFFKKFTIILIGLAFLMALFVTMGLMFGGVKKSTKEIAAESMKNTMPVAKIQMKGDEPEVSAIDIQEKIEMVAEKSSAMEGDDAGKTTYEGICVACHSSGIPGIPQLGDVAAWTSRIEQGNDVLYEHAIVGYTGASGMPMPAKGGNLDLSDAAVRAAVDYMIINSQ